jgi:hypothetical protein
MVTRSQLHAGKQLTGIFISDPFNIKRVKRKEVIILNVTGDV